MEEATEPIAWMDTPGALPIEPADGIPEDVVRAIYGSAMVEDRKRLKRPRIIFSTRLTRASADFRAAKERTQPPG